MGQFLQSDPLMASHLKEEAGASQASGKTRGVSCETNGDLSLVRGLKCGNSQYYLPLAHYYELSNSHIFQESATLTYLLIHLFV